MPLLTLRAPKEFEQGFKQIRDELEIPRGFPTSVLNEANDSFADPSIERADFTHLPLLAIDPEGATDLDQAYFAEKTKTGFRVFYAIADVAAFVTPGNAIDEESRKRGVTLYSPDTKTPLHPPAISEDKASLLQGKVRPALLWTINLDSDGHEVSWNLQRATVKVHKEISYKATQALIDSGSLDAEDPLSLLAIIGKLRIKQEELREGLSLKLPAQEIVAANGGYKLGYESSLPVENWNAQISLLTGMIAAKDLVESGAGVLRNLPQLDSENELVMRRIAQALGLTWDEKVSYPKFVRSLNASTPQTHAFLVQATRSFRGAGYLSFNSEKDLPENPQHSAIASLYSHVTAPLRRLVDRYNNEILLAFHGGYDPPAWAVEALDELPSTMNRARQLDSRLERAILNFAEALTLEKHIGETFDGFVVDKKLASAKRRNTTSVVLLKNPAVEVSLESDLELAQTVKLKLESVSVEERQIKFGELS